MTSHKIIPREGWTTRKVALVPVPRSKRRGFMVHYEGGQPVGSHTGPEVPRAIEAFHINGRGYRAGGYNFVVDQAGGIYAMRGWDAQGAHCTDYNTSDIGVQLHIGGSETPSPAALAAVRWLYDQACQLTGRTLVRRGHSDGFATECPGPKLLGWVRQGMPYPAGTTPAPPAGGSGSAHQVSLAALVKAAKADPKRKQGGTTPGAADDVRLVEAALVKARILAKTWASDGSYGGQTVAAYAAWQRSLGYRGAGADGIPGRESLSKLGARYGFKVVA